ncbi:hemerythrin domain-containing protein [Rhodoferax saidenbachensis]|uniref:Iron-sulfur cluster repair protein YtfE (RIC family) n=1 Tax=Rhodoferax saidenbachensis TaxID=1484693 RepID=A0ABU1ZKC3_9BURK|nr:hemerythrin domain-containing protein [Rhodoferax saidenbachensis]MDR7305989.1 iron-sulfur cluster repair protein YtfE (RIC family) [Rhodoferax saidenbachensis]
MARSPLPLIAHPAPQAGFEAPFEMLAACHERVHRSLALLQRLQQHLVDMGCDDNARQAARDVLRYFDIAAPLHHQDEELHVFPPLLLGADVALRAQVRQLMQDHRDMEAAWAAARQVLLAIAGHNAGPLALTPAQTAALDQFAALYGQHMVHEDGLVYPAAQAVLSVPALQAMAQDMMARRGVRVPPTV